ncbi:hypothetical protein PoB_004868100 [Plakobranchus ocellatus]|uniref:Uncharacterized protein n=1 Tax=Plakobranchus ocellatus TaxID=259542 RepID=A0AAV4BNX8_9GAST|nr:hypothetical protein PoB_004868100 [Plakobranchus ocellatus]
MPCPQDHQKPIIATMESTQENSALSRAARHVTYERPGAGTKLGQEETEIPADLATSQGFNDFSTMGWVGFLYKTSPQKGDLRLLGPPSGRGADGGARTRDRRVPADLRADSQVTVAPMPHFPTIL